jgi:hypothetical protein
MLVESASLGQLCNGSRASMRQLFCLRLGAMTCHEGAIFFLLYGEGIREKKGLKCRIRATIVGVEG